MSDELQQKMMKAWKWEQNEGVNFDDFISFMFANYRYEYDGLEYDPDFGKLVRKLDQEQKIINDKQRYAYFQKR